MTYAKSFANGNERKMKEILKTPGVEVDKNCCGDSCTWKKK
jgi:hypothetical protein